MGAIAFALLAVCARIVWPLTAFSRQNFFPNDGEARLFYVGQSLVDMIGDFSVAMAAVLIGVGLISTAIGRKSDSRQQEISH